MMVASGVNADGKPRLVLGITRENVERLQAGQPIRVPRQALDKCGFEELEVFVLYGDELADLEAQVQMEKPA